MAFRVAARTLLHLGAELISSDTVALYELVKNAYDAGSPRVKISVLVRMEPAICIELLDLLAEFGTDQNDINDIKMMALDNLKRPSPRVFEVAADIESCNTPEEMKERLIRTNRIEVVDAGEGMSLETLRDVFLVIGTRSRRQKSVRTDGRPYLGEKGLGRLAAMRLGSKLRIESTVRGETHWNLLEIDWSLFSHDSDAFLDTIDVEPQLWKQKDNIDQAGTNIFISGLNAAWTPDKLQKMVVEDLSKLTNPFQAGTLFPIQILYNEEPLSIPRFDRILKDNAHATMTASFAEVPGEEVPMRLSGSMHFKGQQRIFALEGAHLTSTTRAKPRDLAALGSFTMELYWYNRRILTAWDSIGDRKKVSELVGAWVGGLMVFRDGFRVFPYGGPSDDWLDIDREALGAQGYKVNRRQIIGKVDISSRSNSKLIDMANREGFKDNEEKRILVTLLQYMVNDFRVYLSRVEEEEKKRLREAVTLEDIEERATIESRNLEESLEKLLQQAPGIRELPVVREFHDAVERLQDLLGRMQSLATSYEGGRNKLLNLAGIGLMVEILAHELYRATDNAMKTLENLSRKDAGGRTESLISTLSNQLKTLQKRLSILDPLTISGRQRKEQFDLAGLIDDILDAHVDQFQREKIDASQTIRPENRPRRVNVLAVKGMYVQIVENLLSNSVYWLRQQRLLNPSFRGRIELVLDTENRKLRVTDNGPGIDPALKDEVFDAFYTTKPPGEGKGLGLFIAREIARYHKSDLILASEEDRQPLRTFIMDFGG